MSGNSLPGLLLLLLNGLFDEDLETFTSGHGLGKFDRVGLLLHIEINFITELIIDFNYK